MLLNDDTGRQEQDDALNELSFAVIGAALEVHRTLGPGFLEAVYVAALCVELQLRGIPYARQAAVTLSYKGRPIGEGRVDLLVGGALIVELKAVEALVPVHIAQVLSYLRATDHRLGLLINFNVPSLKQGIKRVAFTPKP